MTFDFIMGIEVFTNIDVLLFCEENIPILLFFLRHRFFLQKLPMIGIIHRFFLFIREGERNDRGIVFSVRGNHKPIGMLIRIDNEIGLNICFEWFDVYMVDAVNICLVNHPAGSITGTNISRGFSFFKHDVRQISGLAVDSKKRMGFIIILRHGSNAVSVSRQINIFFIGRDRRSERN